MKITSLIFIGIFSFSSFASHCTFENTTEAELATVLVSALEELGCSEAPERLRAEDHLLVSVLKYEDKEKEIVGVSVTIVNRKNGRVVTNHKKSGLRPSFRVPRRELGLQIDYDRASEKLTNKVAQQISRELRSGWITE